jgi:hypothetical protein
VLILCIPVILLAAQTSSPQAVESLVGEVTAITSDSIGVRTDAGNLAVIVTDDKTVILRSRPGAANLADATPLPRSEIAPGDRVLARGRVAPGGQSYAVLRLVVMKKADIDAKREQERADWRRRGIGGVITALDATTGQVTVRLRDGRSGQGPSAITVPTAVRQVTFKRYAPDSVAFSKARSSSFAELAVGDQVRILGRRSEDGATFLPEQIVSGAFRTLRGPIEHLDAARGEFRIRAVAEGTQGLTVKITVGSDALVRRLPSATQGATPSGRSPREGGWMRRGGLDEMFERLPPTSLAEFKAGEEVAVLGTRSADPAEMKAMKVLGGLPTTTSSRSSDRDERRGEGRGAGAMGGGDSPDDTLGFGGDVPW